MKMAVPSAALLLKGPLIVTSVLGFLLYPYVVTLSASTLVCLGILVVGLFLTVWDLTRVLQNKLRQSLRMALDSVVLDDLLKSLYDPETGLFAILITTVVGNASMYALPMTKEHRVRLMKSCFWTSDDQTRRMLTAPGGIKELLPDSTRRWLEEDDNEDKSMAVDEGDVVTATGPAHAVISKPPPVAKTSEDRSVDVASVGTAPDDDSSSDDRVQTTRSTVSAARSRDLDGIPLLSENPAPKSSPPETIADQSGAKEDNGQNRRIHLPPQFEDPLVALGEILKDVSADVWKRYIQDSLPSTRVVQSVGVVAATALIVHLRASSLARKILRGVVEGTLTMGLAGTAMTSFAAALAAEPQAMDLLRSAAKDPMAQGTALVDTIYRLVPSQLRTRWKTIVALTVLALVGRLTAARSAPSGRRRRR